MKERKEIKNKILYVFRGIIYWRKSISLNKKENLRAEIIGNLFNLEPDILSMKTECCKMDSENVQNFAVPIPYCKLSWSSHYIYIRR